MTGEADRHTRPSMRLRCNRNPAPSAGLAEGHSIKTLKIYIGWEACLTRKRQTGRVGLPPGGGTGGGRFFWEGVEETEISEGR